jgi:lysophospholipase L1-like esterase
MSNINRLTKKISFSIIAVVIVLFAAEGAFRLIYRVAKGPAWYGELARYAENGSLGMIHNFRAHPQYLYTFQPSPPRIGETGFTGPMPEIPKAPGELRIVVLGDSTSAGEHAWPARLTRLLKANGVHKVGIANLAIPGYTSLEGLNVLRHLGLALEPDIVIAAFGHNDLQAGMYADFKADYSHFRKPFAPPSDAGLRDRFDRLCTRRVFLYAFARRKKGLPPLMGYRLDDYIVLRKAQLLDQPNFGDEFAAAFSGNMSSIADEARDAGAKAVMMTTPWCFDKCPTQSKAILRDGLKVANGIIRDLDEALVIDLEAQLSDRCELFLDHIHATPMGDDVRAEIIYRALAKSEKL